MAESREVAGAELRQKIERLGPQMPEFLGERGITGIGKAGVFLAVALGFRRLSLTYLPAELPGGARMGQAIDAYFAEHYGPESRAPGGALGRFLRGRRSPGGAAAAKDEELLAKRRVLEDGYNAIVPASAPYIAHLAWLDRFDLQQSQIKRRPTLREMYIYTDREVRARLLDLEDKASAAARRLGGPAGRDRDQAILEHVYASEFNRDYLTGMGALFGYPECCVERYAEDRLKGQNVEQRAWEQVREAEEAGRPVDPHAYWVKDFFPCRPDCPAAMAKGQGLEEKCAELGDEVRELYVGALFEALELVRSYPALIARHRERLEHSRRGPGEAEQ
jgi:hypothetical protein